MCVPRPYPSVNTLSTKTCCTAYAVCISHNAYYIHKGRRTDSTETSKTQWNTHSRRHSSSSFIVISFIRSSDEMRCIFVHIIYILYTMFFRYLLFLYTDFFFPNKNPHLWMDYGMVKAWATHACLALQLFLYWSAFADVTQPEIHGNKIGNAKRLIYEVVHVQRMVYTFIIHHWCTAVLLSTHRMSHFAYATFSLDF